jgi:hypothetical protein
MVPESSENGFTSRIKVKDSYVYGGIAGRDINIGNLEKRYDEDTAKVITMIAEEVKRRNDPATAKLFSSFTDELNRPQPDKSTLRSFWSLLEKALPTINSIAGVASKIVPLLS